MKKPFFSKKYSYIPICLFVEWENFQKLNSEEKAQTMKKFYHYINQFFITVEVEMWEIFNEEEFDLFDIKNITQAKAYINAIDTIIRHHELHLVLNNLQISREEFSHQLMEIWKKFPNDKKSGPVFQLLRYYMLEEKHIVGAVAQKATFGITAMNQKNAEQVILAN